MSTFANLIRRFGDNKEGLTPNYWEVTLSYCVPDGAGTLAEANNLVSYTLPVDAMLVKAEMNINSSGAAANATTLSIERIAGKTTPALTTDLTGGALSIAAASATLYDYTDIEDTTFVPLRENKGAIYTVCVDDIPNAVVATLLVVTLGFVSL